MDVKGGVNNGSVPGMYRVKEDFEWKAAVLVGASSARECDGATQMRMAKNIYPWYDPACITLEKKVITNGHF